MAADTRPAKKPLDAKRLRSAVDWGSTVETTPADLAWCIFDQGYGAEMLTTRATGFWQLGAAANALPIGATPFWFFPVLVFFGLWLRRVQRKPTLPRRRSSKPSDTWKTN